MTDTRILAKSPTRMLKEDHRIVKELFAEYAGLDEGDIAEKERIFEELYELLTIHAETEEQVFYPAVWEARSKDAEGIVNEAVEEHQIVKTLLEEMSGLDAGDEHFEAKMKVLRESVEHHAGEEEKDMFPLAKKLPQKVQDQLRADMESLRSRHQDHSGE